MYYFCTYFDKNYLVRGLALYQSLMRNVQSFTFYVLCLDNFTYNYLLNYNQPNVRPISMEDFENGDNELIKAKKDRSHIEYYFTCTPSLPLYLLNRFPDIDIITYLDADLYFYEDPGPIYKEFGDKSILIIEHRFPEDTSEFSKTKNGIYNVGFISFRNDMYGKECLLWWRKKCLEWCYDRIEPGRFADQKYLDYWPARFSNLKVLQYKGANIGMWNLSTYPMSIQNGRVLVDSDPLIFMHFNSFKVILPFLFNPSLPNPVPINRQVRQKIIYPYLFELHRLMRKSSINIGYIREDNPNNILKYAFHLLESRLVLLVEGMAIEIYLGRIIGILKKIFHLKNK